MLFEQKQKERDEQIGSEVRYQLERWLVLQVIDHHWKEHLLMMEDLREGIGFRGYAQRNPEHEYKIESHKMFDDMLEKVKIDFIKQLMQLKVVLNTLQEHEKTAAQKKTPEKKQKSGTKILTPFDNEVEHTT